MNAALWIVIAYGTAFRFQGCRFLLYDCINTREGGEKETSGDELVTLVSVN
jgi:hypothetical protein